MEIHHVVWMIRTSWCRSLECGGDVSLYNDESKARAEFKKAAEEELSSYSDLEDCTVEYCVDSLVIYKERFYSSNHFEMICEPVPVI